MYIAFICVHLSLSHPGASTGDDSVLDHSAESIAAADGLACRLQETNQTVPGWLNSMSARAPSFGGKSRRGGGGGNRFGGRDFRHALVLSLAWRHMLLLERSQLSACT